jgi:IMP dehydrogenase
MAKEIILEPGRTFSEFVVHTDYTPRDVNINSISLESVIAGVPMKIPLFSSAMTCVTDYDMCYALGKEGGMGVLPARMPIQTQSGVVKRLKGLEMGFVDEPIKVRENATTEEVLRMIDHYGHSKVPICDMNNTLLGIFTRKHYWEVGCSPTDPVTTLMIPLDQLHTCAKPDIKVGEALKLMEKKETPYLVVLDEQDRLVKLAFSKDMDEVRVGAAIDTHPGYEERILANIEAGVDMMFIDSSDGFKGHVKKTLEDYKNISEAVPLCAGNIITFEGAKALMEWGADVVKVGMSSGSDCTTAREKAIGRAPMTALMEADRARIDYLTDSDRDVYLLMDGGIRGAADLNVALAIAHGAMMGGYFNQFYEAAGEKYDKDRKVTTNENAIRYVATMGEGSDEARNLGRYGHGSQKTFFAEGESGEVDYAGRLKPKLKDDLIRVKAALENNGCRNLEEYRQVAVPELLSDTSMGIVKDPHGIVKRD